MGHMQTIAISLSILYAPYFANLVHFANLIILQIQMYFYARRHVQYFSLLLNFSNFYLIQQMLLMVNNLLLNPFGYMVCVCIYIRIYVCVEEYMLSTIKISVYE